MKNSTKEIIGHEKELETACDEIKDAKEDTEKLNIYFYKKI